MLSLHVFHVLPVQNALEMEHILRIVLLDFFVQMAQQVVCYAQLAHMGPKSTCQMPPNAHNALPAIIVWMEQYLVSARLATSVKTGKVPRLQN